MGKLKTNTVIVLINYNGCSDTIDCVNSIVENEPELDKKIIIIDNSEKAEDELFNFQKDQLDITLLRQDNHGFGSANNYAIAHANAHFVYDYLLLLNNDTVISKHSITNMINCFQLHNDIGIVTCKIMFADEPTIVWYGGGEIDYVNIWPILTEYKCEATASGADLSRYVSFSSGCVMLFSQEALNTLKGFDDRLFMYVEDLELSIRADKADIRIWYTSESVIYHKVQGGKSPNNRGIHPKNRNVSFHFYHKFLNRWIVGNKFLSGQELRVFRKHFWRSYNKTLLRLYLLSPKRFDVMRTSNKLKLAIRQYG